MRYILYVCVLLLFLVVLFFSVFLINKKRAQTRNQFSEKYVYEITPMQTIELYFYIVIASFSILYMYDSILVFLFGAVMLYCLFCIASDRLNRIYLSKHNLLLYQGFGKPYSISANEIKYAKIYRPSNEYLSRNFSYLEISTVMGKDVRIRKDNPSYSLLYSWLLSNRIEIRDGISLRSQKNSFRKDLF